METNIKEQFSKLAIDGASVCAIAFKPGETLALTILEDISQAQSGSVARFVLHFGATSHSNLDFSTGQIFAQIQEHSCEPIQLDKNESINSMAQNMQWRFRFSLDQGSIDFRASGFCVVPIGSVEVVAE